MDYGWILIVAIVVGLAICFWPATENELLEDSEDEFSEEELAAMREEIEKWFEENPDAWGLDVPDEIKYGDLTK